jgi:hypothetical protein
VNTKIAAVILRNVKEINLLPLFNLVALFLTFSTGWNFVNSITLHKDRVKMIFSEIYSTFIGNDLLFKEGDKIVTINSFNCQKRIYRHGRIKWVTFKIKSRVKNINLA